MITESEKKVLQLAKKVFEHFTHDALPIAREIIAMELELGEAPIKGELSDETAKQMMIFLFNPLTNNNYGTEYYSI